MEFESGYLLALVVVGLGILGIILALGIGEVSRKKSVVTLILSLIILGLGAYYYYEIGLVQRKKGGETFNQLNALIRVYCPLETELPEK